MTEAPDQLRSPPCLSPVKTLMSHPLPRTESAQLVTNRLSLTVALGPTDGQVHMFNVRLVERQC